MREAHARRSNPNTSQKYIGEELELRMRPRELLVGFVMGVLLAPFILSAFGRSSQSEGASSSGALIPSNLPGSLRPLTVDGATGGQATAAATTPAEPVMVEEARNANVPRMRHRYSVRPLPSQQQQQQQQPPLRQTAQAAGTGTTAVAVAAPSGVVRASAAGSRRSPGRRFHLVQSLWQPTPDEAPWYFAGAGGRSNRARSQLAMRKSSGYLARDSALPPARGASQPSQPVLTGTSWHWPLPATPAGGGGRAVAPCGGGCGANGVCVPHLGRCDCGPYWWGADCSIPVVCTNPQCICVYNDSNPWFCDAPQCRRDPNELVRPAPGQPPRRCVGRPLDKCPKSCSGRGRCLGGAFGGGSCACFEGFAGRDCSQPVPSTQCLSNCSGRGECLKGWCRCKPPYWGTDCARGGPRRADGSRGRHGPRCTASPCVYVYDLPPRMNVLALKAEFDWRLQVRGKKFDYRTPPMLHEALLASPHRTVDPTEADLFYVPTWDWHGSWGNAEVYYRAHRYISTFYPYWNASGGADHVWAIARDAAACDTPW